MRVIFFSDLHAHIPSIIALAECINKEQATHLISCGDYFEPSFFLEPAIEREVIIKMNALPLQIYGVMGNNDDRSQLEQLTSNVQRTSFSIVLDTHTFYITHGHRHNVNNLPPGLHPEDIFVQGHTHIAGISTEHGHLCFNPGSISFPRSHWPASYGLYTNDTLSIKSLNGDVLDYIIL